MNTDIGRQLRKEREARDLTIDQAAAATRIRAHYLTAIENGDLDRFPSTVHARGFLRAYADFLGLDAEPIIQELEGKDPPVSPPTAAATPAEPALNQAALKHSGEIFVEVGNQLRNQRELLGLSLEDVERHTHLRQHYLRALEAGDLNGLPSPVQGRGMLDNYASFLGMNSETLLLLFAEGLQAQLDARRGADSAPAKSEPVVEAPTPRSRLRGLLSPDILIAIKMSGDSRPLSRERGVGASTTGSDFAGAESAPRRASSCACNPSAKSSSSVSEFIPRNEA